MVRSEIDELIKGLEREKQCKHPQLIETHISWVILCEDFAYKIKKPITYSFLDFSTAARRKHFCDRELELNRRLTQGVYLDVQEIVRDRDGLHIHDTCGGEVIGHAVRMRRLDNSKQMNVLLAENRVDEKDIVGLAKVIADFHATANIIYHSNAENILDKFNALRDETAYLRSTLGEEAETIIKESMVIFDAFTAQHQTLIRQRLKEGLFRDVHGDLHTRNIFLLPEPVVFDCIEFNDDYRQIDVLNEVAFLCMDLDAFGRADLADLFVKSYNNLFPSVRTKDEHRLLMYYKSYRANVRAKVNCLRAKSADSDDQKLSSLHESYRYLRLMRLYLEMD